MVANVTPPQINKKSTNFNLFNNFMEEYIPKTNEICFPIIGFVVSCFTFSIVINYLNCYERINSYHMYNYDMYNYGYIVITATCNIQLQCGLLEKNKKKFFYWIILKLVEIVMLLATLVSSHNWRCYTLQPKIMGYLLLSISVIMVLFLIVPKKLQTNKRDESKENIYDTPNVQQIDDNTYSNVTVY